MCQFASWCDGLKASQDLNGQCNVDRALKRDLHVFSCVGAETYSVTKLNLTMSLSCMSLNVQSRFACVSDCLDVIELNVALQFKVR